MDMGPVAERSLQQGIDIFCSMLKYPAHPYLLTVVGTDASSDALGGLLLQDHGTKAE